MTAPTDYLTTSATARLHRVSRYTVTRAIRLRELPAVAVPDRAGRPLAYLIRRADAEAWKPLGRAYGITAYNEAKRACHPPQTPSDATPSL